MSSSHLNLSTNLDETNNVKKTSVTVFPVRNLGAVHPVQRFFSHILMNIDSWMFSVRELWSYNLYTVQKRKTVIKNNNGSAEKEQ